MLQIILTSIIFLLFLSLVLIISKPSEKSFKIYIYLSIYDKDEKKLDPKKSISKQFVEFTMNGLKGAIIEELINTLSINYVNHIFFSQANVADKNNTDDTTTDEIYIRIFGQWFLVYQKNSKKKES